jgi:tetratricopeptide (TPR) repeat protein
MASAFDDFLAQAWADHADRSEAVAQRLRTDTPAPESPQQLAALARFVVHLCGEHLGAFDDGRWRLAALATHPLADAGVQSALRVGRASLTLAETGAADWRGFNTEEQVRTEAAAAAISLGRHNTARALALLQAARRRVAALPNAGAAVHRPLGIACHNMAWTLHDRGNARSAQETAAMLEFAAGSKLHWSQAGTWLEIERGDYDLARCHLAAGQLDEALNHAAQCLATCTENDAPPYEHFFAYEALARVQHARGDAPARARNLAAAQAAFDKLPADDQAGCRATLDELKALGP